MRVHDVMTKTVASCRPEANLAAATALMWEYGCGLLPVVNHQARVTGVITDRDICIALGTRNQRACEIQVNEVTYRPVVLCEEDDDLRAALKVMAAERVRRLPVVDQEGALVGILSLEDITLQARHHGDTDRPPVSFEDVMNTLRAIYKRGSRAGDTHLPAAARALCLQKQNGSVDLGRAFAYVDFTCDAARNQRD